MDKRGFCLRQYAAHALGYVLDFFEVSAHTPRGLSLSLLLMIIIKTLLVAHGETSG